MTSSSLRSARLDVRNPLLALPASAALVELSTDLGAPLRNMLNSVRGEARLIAGQAWHACQDDAAVYWKCVAVYAGHIAKLIGPCGRAAPLGVLPPLKREAFRSKSNPVLRLPAARSLASLPPAARTALTTLFEQMRLDASARAAKCWSTHKAPLASYWRKVAKFIGHLAKVLKSLERAS